MIQGHLQSYGQFSDSSSISLVFFSSCFNGLRHIITIIVYFPKNYTLVHMSHTRKLYVNIVYKCNRRDGCQRNRKFIIAGRHITLCTITHYHACNMVMIEAILCAGIATQPHAMASMSASGPAGAWEIVGTRIPPFISKPNEHRSSGGGIRWVAALVRITT